MIKAIVLAAGLGVAYGSASCTLEAPATDGTPTWVQTGPAGFLFTNEYTPRQLITDATEIPHGSYFVLYCNEYGYTIDASCVVTCVDGDLDYETYCDNSWVTPNVGPEGICKYYTETVLYEECDAQVSFTSDDEFGDSGMSLKDTWAAVLGLSLIHI